MIPVGEWLPDLPVFQNPGATEALNVRPAAKSYRPLPDLAAVSDALTARAQGAASIRGIAGAVGNFGGDATKLYKLGSSNTYDDVSRTVGGAYATAATGGWSFAAFNDDVMAVNGVDAAQVYTVGSSTDFAALAGTPPVARFVAVVREFAVMLQVSGAKNRAQWSAFGDNRDWVASATTQSDEQDLPDGGQIMGGVGGEFGVIFQERAIRRMTYVGPPTIFQFDKIAVDLGCPCENAIAAWGGNIFFPTFDGFMLLQGGQAITPIGDGKVDRYFWANVDQTYLDRVTATVDPIEKMYVVSYPTAAGAGTPNSLLFFHWPTGKWSRGEINMEMLFPAMSAQSYTLEDLDTLFATLELTTPSLDSPFWTGSGRFVLAAFTTAHRLGLFSGDNLAPTVETGEFQLYPGRRALIRGARPIADGGTLSLALGTRNRTVDAVSWGSATAQNSDGFVPLRSDARYHRGRLTVAAGGVWNHIQGIDEILARPSGSR